MAEPWRLIPALHGIDHRVLSVAEIQATNHLFPRVPGPQIIAKTANRTGATEPLRLLNFRDPDGNLIEVAADETAARDEHR